MGEGTDRVNGERANGEPRKMARELETEITEIRSRLDRSLAELDRRRHELTDVRLQVRRHPMVAFAAGVTVLALVGGVAYAVWAARQRNKPVSKARRLKHALSRMIDQPQKVAKPEPTVPEKILAAAGTAAATMLVKKMMERAFDSVGRETAAAR
ncbi:MAG TPA: hypothetical protein VF994_07495 [Myxococcales bacterium]